MSDFFISYAHADRDFAERVDVNIRGDGFTTWIDSGIHAGDEWKPAIDEAIREALAVIVIMSPSAKDAEFVTYEWSFALGMGLKVIPLKYKHVDKPHTRLQNVQGFDFITQKPWESLQKELQKIKDSESHVRVTMRKVSKAVSQIEKNPSYNDNTAFRYMVNLSLQEMGEEIERVGIGPKHSVPAEEYVRYLVAIQHSLHAQVKALAVVGQQEKFWQQKPGQRIMQTAHRDSARVFVFDSKDAFTSHFKTLVEHAQCYHVYAMSFKTLLSKFRAYDSDFSIITTDDSQIFAEYGDDVALLRTMRFSAIQADVALREEIFQRLISESQKIMPENKTEDLDRLIDEIFEEDAPHQPQPPAREMSRYINIDSYDEHEERHAYYKEMMEKMISVGLESRTNDDPYRIIELGAGTGIFTARLATKLPLVSECVAVEIDHVCFSKLQHKLRGTYPKVHLVYHDCLVYEPEGTFQYVFSSFSDHHIQLTDKPKYFEVIKRMLAPGGKYIVGDEFLPAHDPDDLDAWRQALKTYHGHIIADAQQHAAQERAIAADATTAEERAEYEARAQSYIILASLESAALRSGLRRQGDFKVSCAQYEASLQSSGLTFEKWKIGPLDNDAIGGVYVYAISVA